MAISFKYKILPGKKGKNMKTPSIPITLIGNNSTPIEVVALIDSGADVSVIPQGLAEFLNLNLKGKIEKSTGIGGEVSVKNSYMTIKIMKNHENYEFQIPVQIILGKDEVPPLLGRNTFFDKFVIKFDNLKEKITLKSTKGRYGK